MIDYNMSFDYCDYVQSKPKRTRTESAQSETTQSETIQSNTLPSQEIKFGDANWFVLRNNTASDVGAINENHCSQRRNKRNNHISK